MNNSVSEFFIFFKFFNFFQNSYTFPEIPFFSTMGISNMQFRLKCDRGIPGAPPRAAPNDGHSPSHSASPAPRSPGATCLPPLSNRHPRVRCNRAQTAVRPPPRGSCRFPKSGICRFPKDRLPPAAARQLPLPEKQHMPRAAAAAVPGRPPLRSPQRQRWLL